MIELIQFPWSPFCIVQRRILEYSGTRFHIRDIPNVDRTVVWKLTKQRYYGVPIVKHGASVVFETGHDSQVIAKYLDCTLKLDLFPRTWDGVQTILWRTIENEVESFAFRLNDIYYEEFIPEKDRLPFIRHKERKFGVGCLEEWKGDQAALLEGLARTLTPFEQMLSDKLFLLDSQPRFVDFDLFGMLGNFLYSGHYKLPALHTRLKAWHQRMTSIQFDSIAREKLHS